MENYSLILFSIELKTNQSNIINNIEKEMQEGISDHHNYSKDEGKYRQAF